MQLAIIQCAFGQSKSQNIQKVEHFAAQAVREGAEVILAPELFETLYFAQSQDPSWFEEAREVTANQAVITFQAFCKQHRVAMPISFFEKEGPCYYNSIAMIGTEGEIMGVYRKTHIPDGPGYQEKFFFRPGNTGFKVWDTPFGKVGVGICWDQWFPEAARTMALMGADVLLYPTAIGSEPDEGDGDPYYSQLPWLRAMQGHAVCNAISVAAANRLGTEANQHFFGTSFICDHRGDILTQLNDTHDASSQDEGFAIESLDLLAQANYRASWGFFRDRRPGLYMDEHTSL